MKYYIKDQTTKDVRGPYSVEEINTQIASGGIAHDKPWLATSAIGETIEKARASPPGDWRPLSLVSGVNPGLLAPDAYPAPDEDTRSTGFTIAVVVGAIALAVSVWWLYTSGTEESHSYSESQSGGMTTRTYVSVNRSPC